MPSVSDPIHARIELEVCNYLKQKGFKVSFSKINEQWVKQNIEHVTYYAYFSLPKEPLSKFATYMEHQEDIEMGIFRY